MYNSKELLKIHKKRKKIATRVIQILLKLSAQHIIRIASQEAKNAYIYAYKTKNM